MGYAPTQYTGTCESSLFVLIVTADDVLITLKLNPNFAPILNYFVISFSFVLLMFGINYLKT